MANSNPNPQEAQRWGVLNGKLDQRLLRGIDTMGFEFMTPVQHMVLNQLPGFQSDCLVQAKTGSGKTVAFLLPALHSLLSLPPLLRGQVAILVLSPTRELALQIAKECESLTSQITPRLECHTAYGGTAKDRELKKFMSGDPKILVATPGRLNDYLNDHAVTQKFSKLRTLVLDECDTMLDAGFLVAINDILRRLPPKTQGWQGMGFSATIPSKLETVLAKLLKPGFTRLSTVNEDEAPTIDRVPQHSVIIPTLGETFTTLLALLRAEYELAPNNFKVICFGATANGVALTTSLLTELLRNDNLLRKVQIFQLQSRLSQNVRVRTTDQFKAATGGIMLASDVIGRGMDFPHVSLVIQLGLPASGDAYVHRVGRTARAGNEGRASIILTQRESFFLKVNKRLTITPYPVNLAPVAESLTGDVQAAFDRVDGSTKTKAYQAWLGFHKTFTKQLQLSNEGLVEQANEYASAMGCPETPMIDKRVVGKMGLKGVRGLNVGLVETNQPKRKPQPDVNEVNGKHPRMTSSRIEGAAQNSDKETLRSRGRGGAGGGRGRGGRGRGRGRAGKPNGATGGF